MFIKKIYFYNETFGCFLRVVLALFLSSSPHHDHCSSPHHDHCLTTHRSKLSYILHCWFCFTILFLASFSNSCGHYLSCVTQGSQVLCLGFFFFFYIYTFYKILKISHKSNFETNMKNTRKKYCLLEDHGWDINLGRCV